MNKPDSRQAWAITITYSVLACLWVLFSDQLFIQPEAAAINSFSSMRTMQGWVFVGISAIIIFFSLSLGRKVSETSDTPVSDTALPYLAVLDNLPIMIVALDNEGIPVYWNQECENVTGYSYTEMRAQALSASLEAGKKICPFCSLFKDPELAHSIFGNPNANCSGDQRAEDTSVHRPSGLKFIEAAIKCKSGEAAVICWYPMQGKSPVEDWVIWAAGVNINDRIILERDLLIAAKADSLALLAGGMAHDFRNLLTAMEGGISLAADLIQQVQKSVSPSSVSLDLNQSARTLEKLNESSEVLRESISACNKGKEMAVSLQAFSRSRQSMNVAQVHPVQLLTQCVEDSLQDSEHRVIWEIAPNVGNISCDPEILTQIVGNLVLNARQSMDERGLLTIRMERVDIIRGTILPVIPGSYLRIQILDQGTGMEEILLNRIFDPYFTTKSNGTGLGLTTALACARRHGGTITVRSRPGEGSTFSFYIPTGETETQQTENLLPAANPELNRPVKGYPVHRVAQNTSRPGRGQARILLVDDEEHILKITPRLLNRLGLSCDGAPSGEEAIKLIHDAIQSGIPYSLMILDLTLPGEERGDLILKKVKKIAPDLKTLVSSGYAEDEVIVNYSKFGFDGAVRKPYDLASLKEAVRSVLEEANSDPLQESSNGTTESKATGKDPIK